MAALREPTIAPDSAPSALAVYMRVSGEEQKRKGTIENQRTAIDRYLNAYGLTSYGSYEDEAISGHFVAFGNRPEGMRLLADVKGGHVKCVLVWKLDRFGRNAREILNAVHELDEQGVQLVSIREHFDTSTPAGRLMLTMLAAIAEYEWELIMERTSAGVERRLEHNAYMGGRPSIGYRIEGKEETARVVVNDLIDAQSGHSEADLPPLAWHLLVERDMRIEAIAEYLTDDLHIPTRGGGRWAPSVIHRMLTDPTYTGALTYRAKDGTVHTHEVTPLLTQEQYQRAQAKLDDHKRYSHRNPNHDYLLRDLMRCAHCGKPYTTAFTRLATGKPWRYYACSTSHYRGQYYHRHQAQPQNCNGRTVDAAKIEAQIWADVEQFIREPGRPLALLAAKMQGQADQADAHRERLAALQQELDAQQRERDAMLALFRKGRISERDLDRQLDAIDQEEAGHLRERERLLTAMQSATDAQQRMQSARSLLQRLRARLDSADEMTPDLKRELIELLVAAIRVETVPDGISKRGNRKERADVVVTYVFDEPADQAAQVRGVSASAGGESSSS